MALDETAQIAIEESLENKEELTRMENEINTQLTNNQKTKTKPEKSTEPPSPYNTPIKQQESKGLTTEEKIKEANEIFDFTSPNSDAIRKLEFPLSIPSNQWSFALPMPHLMHFSPTYVQTPSSINKAPAKPNFSEFGQKKNKITMEEDISNFNQVILRQSNKSKNLKNKTEQHHNEQSKDQLEDQINKSLQKVDKNLPQLKL
ncbi:hypothetical protein ACTFIY_003679 [Dictyostelium cf. discoideum]